MKKLVIMIIISLNILAGKYSEIAKDVANETNIYYSERISELLNIPMDEIDDLNKNVEDLKKLRDITENYNENKINPYVVVGLSTNHLFEEDSGVLNEHNNLLGIGIEYKKYELTYLHFDNSLYQKTNAILFRKNVDMKWNISYNYGVSVVVGYEKNYVLHKNGMKYTAPNNFVIYDNIGIMPTIGLTYNTKHIDLNCDLFGNALITSIKYKF